jgi:hypothetical protein
LGFPVSFAPIRPGDRHARHGGDRSYGADPDYVFGIEPNLRSTYSLLACDLTSQLWYCLIWACLQGTCRLGGDTVGHDADGEGAGGVVLAAAVDGPAEDQADPVGPAEAGVVADDLLEEDPPADGPVRHLGQRELGQQYRDVIPVSGSAVCGGERVRHGQPFAQQRVDLRRDQTVADGLQGGRVIDGGKAVVQRLEADPGPWRPAAWPTRCR